MKKFEYEDLQQKVYKAIKEMMLTGELKANEKLAQETLARRLGVSRTPILAAFSKLEKDMLVVNLPRRGVFVRQFSTSELVDIYDIRVRLESLGALQAANHVNEENIARLRALAARFAECIDGDRIESIKEADYSLHMEIMRQGESAFLFEMISTFNIVLIANHKGLQKDPRKSDAEHRRIIDAIAVGDGERAEQAMYEHILESRNVLFQTLREEEREVNNATY
ncbi:MAG TPA: GntR family transcriptional regulator [Spirochaetia bacterium]|nr:GntR family transcriptional regulator [Spirochaetia bacterium]